jgi:hypothetical protein
MSKNSRSSRLAIAVAVYRPEQYARLLATADDASDLEPTWQEWHTVYQETRQQMAELGMNLIEVTVDLDDLENFCQEQGLKNTSGTRAQYAAHMLYEQHQQQKQLQSPSPLKPHFKKKKRRSDK